ncbi:MAG: TolC family protein [Bryobacteraceae bacterium]|nr:TolC family protein [Bryobacteraceae bacterium]
MKLVPLCLLLTVLAHAQDAIPLSLQRAVEIALAPEGSARIRLAREAVKAAEARSDQARGALLPDVAANLGYLSQTTNLAARGIQFTSPFPGFSIPSFVGPFTTFDARLTFGQSIFDLAAVRRFQASRRAVETARSEDANAADFTTELVARAYLAALRAQASVETANANVKLAQELVDLAQAQRKAGTGIGIEVTRANVQLSNENQRLIVAENELERARLQLLRTIGLRLDSRIQLTDALAYRPTDPVTVAQAMETARKFRDVLAAQERREEGARLNYSAVKWERLPTLAALADYGSLGSGLSNSLPTRTYGLSLRVPIFDGGRRDARRAEAASLYRQERIRTQDLRDQVELEIRLALESLQSGDAQVATAREGLTQAEAELASARRRYEAGVAPSIEVTDAQTRLARARDNLVSALFNHNLARLDLTAAQGTIERTMQ